MNPQSLHIAHPTIRAEQPSEQSLVKFETVDILGVPVAAISHSMLSSFLYHHIVTESRGWITYANIHSVNLTYSTPWLKSFFRESLLIYCDGQGVRLGAMLLGKRIPERITLPDYIDDLCFLLRDHQFTLFLLGSHSDSTQRAVEKLQERFPGLIITGCQGGYFTPAETPQVVEAINKANPDVLIVGMGMTRQEEWVRENFHHLNATIVWIAGGVLDLIAGTKTRSPRWMSNWGLEWLYRLLQEPQRLWRRYLFGNPLFFLRILKHQLSNHSSRASLNGS